MLATTRPNSMHSRRLISRRARNARPAKRLADQKNASRNFFRAPSKTRLENPTQTLGTHQKNSVFAYDFAPGCVVVSKKTPNPNQQECDRLAGAVRTLNQSNIDNSHALIALGWTGGYNPGPAPGPIFYQEFTDNVIDEVSGLVSAFSGLIPNLAGRAFAAAMSGADLLHSSKPADRMTAAVGTADAYIKFFEAAGAEVAPVVGKTLGRAAVVGNVYLGTKIAGVPILHVLQRASEEFRGAYEGVPARLQGYAESASNQIRYNNDQLGKIAAKMETLGCNN